jgi:hypothetical protein
MTKSEQWQGIPTQLSLEQFRQFVLPHLSIGSRAQRRSCPCMRCLVTLDLMQKSDSIRNTLKKLNSTCGRNCCF